MPRAIDITGRRYGKLVAISVTRTSRGGRGWLCQCDCGNQVVVVTDALGTGNTTSCGCTRQGFIDRTGHVYGNLTVIREDTSQKFRQGQWICRCICGNEVSKRSGDLGYHGKKRCALDCGCLWKQNMGAARRLAEGLAAMRQILRRSKANAIERGYSWDLTDEQADILMQQPCFYCGAVPANISSHPQLHGMYIYNGIDRLDNDRGYEHGNVVPCCKFCNYAKHDRTVPAFLDWIERAYKHSIQSKRRKSYVKQNKAGDIELCLFSTAT